MQVYTTAVGFWSVTLRAIIALLCHYWTAICPSTAAWSIQAETQDHFQAQRRKSLEPAQRPTNKSISNHSRVLIEYKQLWQIMIYS